MTGKHVLQGRGKQALITGAAGVLLGLPLTLSAGDAPAPVQVAPLPPATSSAPITQTAGPAAPQFRSQQYNDEVQRQLELLYQQDPNSAGQPNLPKPPAGPPQPKKMKPKDWFNPTAWKRYNKSKQRVREYEERQRQAASATPETTLGAPADFTHGGAAPLAPAASYAPQYTAAPAPAAQPVVVPAPGAEQPEIVPAPSAVAARPQLQRVSPEVFQYPADASGSTPAAETRVADVAPAPQRLRLLPVPGSAAPNTADASVAQTPLLILTPEPQPAPSDNVALRSAPPTELESAQSSDAAAASNGFLNEPAESPVDEPTAADLFAAEASPTAEPMPPNPFDVEAGGPYTGLELDDNPFAAPQESSHSGPEAATPATPPMIAADAPPEEPVATLLAPHPGSGSVTARAAIPTRLASESTDLSAPAPLPATTAPERTVAMPVSAATASPVVQQKLLRIAERPGLTGFKGFCPVMLREYRELVDAKLEHTVTYEGRQYWFSSAAARETFLLNPSAYAPARGGIDVVIFDEVGEPREGSLDHAVWYRGRLYLFDSSETQAAFAAQPQLHEAE